MTVKRMTLPSVNNGCTVLYCTYYCMNPAAPTSGGSRQTDEPKIGFACWDEPDQSVVSQQVVEGEALLEGDTSIISLLSRRSCLNAAAAGDKYSGCLFR